MRLSKATALCPPASATAIQHAPARGLAGEDAFRTMLDLEQKRTERSDRRFALMLVQSAGPLKDLGTALLDKIAAALFRATRETDFKGWYKDGSIHRNRIERSHVRDPNPARKSPALIK